MTPKGLNRRWFFKAMRVPKRQKAKGMNLWNAWKDEYPLPAHCTRSQFMMTPTTCLDDMPQGMSGESGASNWNTEDEFSSSDPDHPRFQGGGGGGDPSSSDDSSGDDDGGQAAPSTALVVYRPPLRDEPSRRNSTNTTTSTARGRSSSWRAPPVRTPGKRGNSRLPHDRPRRSRSIAEDSAMDQMKKEMADLRKQLQESKRFNNKGAEKGGPGGRGGTHFNRNDSPSDKKAKKKKSKASRETPRSPFRDDTPPRGPGHFSGNPACSSRDNPEEVMRQQQRAARDRGRSKRPNDVRPSPTAPPVKRPSTTTDSTSKKTSNKAKPATPRPVAPRGGDGDEQKKKKSKEKKKATKTEEATHDHVVPEFAEPSARAKLRARAAKMRDHPKNSESNNDHVQQEEATGPTTINNNINGNEDDDLQLNDPNLLEEAFGATPSATAGDSTNVNDHHPEFTHHSDEELLLRGPRNQSNNGMNATASTSEQHDTGVQGNAMNQEQQQSGNVTLDEPTTQNGGGDIHTEMADGGGDNAGEDIGNGDGLSEFCDMDLSDYFDDSLSSDAFRRMEEELEAAMAAAGNVGINLEEPVMSEDDDSSYHPPEEEATGMDSNINSLSSSTSSSSSSSSYGDLSSMHASQKRGEQE
ncbi:unnamed protein product [Amoebophrya sp. A25]|nr:unnamed protein product [Amoebophrya sp. A25]|eukprot:GSA25T00008177001.1